MLQWMAIIQSKFYNVTTCLFLEALKKMNLDMVSIDAIDQK